MGNIYNKEAELSRYANAHFAPHMRQCFEIIDNAVYDQEKYGQSIPWKTLYAEICELFAEYKDPDGIVHWEQKLKIVYESKLKGKHTDVLYLMQQCKAMISNDTDTTKQFLAAQREWCEGEPILKQPISRNTTTPSTENAEILHNEFHQELSKRKHSKTPKHMASQAKEDDRCCRLNGDEHTFHQIRNCCPCIDRICIVMEIYHKLLVNDELWNSVAISEVIQSDQYGHQQLIDDFNHILYFHNDTGNSRLSVMQKMIYHLTADNHLKCRFDAVNCKGHRRRDHSKPRRDEPERKHSDHDERCMNEYYEMTLREHCDMIHVTLFQFRDYYDLSVCTYPVYNDSDIHIRICFFCPLQFTSLFCRITYEW